MTYYRIISNSTNGGEVTYDNSLEGTALKMKSLKRHIDNLSSKYEILMDEVSSIKEQQGKASKQYTELKKHLIDLAVEDDEDQNEE